MRGHSERRLDRQLLLALLCRREFEAVTGGSGDSYAFRAAA